MHHIPTTTTHTREQQRSSGKPNIHKGATSFLKSHYNLQQTKQNAYTVTGYSKYVAEKILKKITKDLQIEWHKNLTSPTFLGGKFDGNNHTGDKFKGISSNNVGRWKERISKNEACIIEGWLADTMTHWGYQLQYSHNEHVEALSEFYAWYNCKYFFSDSFSV